MIKNNIFVLFQARYDEELQAYLKLTGLQASDLAKPKSRKKTENKSRMNHQAATPPPSQVMNASSQQASLGLPQMPPPGYPGQPMGMQLPNFPANSPQVSVAGALPHFSQIWTTGQFEGQPGQMMMLNAQGQPVQIPNGQAAMAFFQPQLQQLQQQAQQVQQTASEQQQQAQQSAAHTPAAQQTTEALTTYNGSPQVPAASASPHLNSSSPLAGDQQQYEQQQQQQQAAAPPGQFAQWALQQQVLEHQHQQLAVQSFQQQQAESQTQPGSDGSEAKASPQSQLSETNSPAAPASTGVEGGEHNQSMTSHDGDSNSVGSSSATAEVVTTQQQLPQYASAHNNFNSYANFPWNSFPQAAQAQIQADAQALAQSLPTTTTAAAATDANGKPVFTKESILESELSHLRTALSEQTKEVQRLGQELEKAYSVIDQLKAERAQLQVHAQQQAQVNAQAQAQIQAQAQAAQAQAQAAQAQLEAQSQLNLGLKPSPPTPANSSPAATM